MDVILTVYLAGNVQSRILVHTKIKFKFFADFLHKKQNIEKYT